MADPSIPRHDEFSQSRGIPPGAREHRRTARRLPSRSVPHKPAPEQHFVQIRAISDTSYEHEHYSYVPVLQKASSPSQQDLGIRNLSLGSQKLPQKRPNSFLETLSSRSPPPGLAQKTAHPGADTSIQQRRPETGNPAPIRSDHAITSKELHVDAGGTGPRGISNLDMGQSTKRLRQDNSPPTHRGRISPLNAAVSVSGVSVTSQDAEDASSLPKQMPDEKLHGKDNTLSITKEPDARPISEDQLAAEVKGIYAGLILVEAKCVNVVATQTLALQEPNQTGGTAPLHNDHWQALIALHRTLLHEHHDFFLASQHPSASSALRDLASRYSMPARMWKHGIHSFLELLRRRLPHSLDFMITFIYLSYEMIALLFETVPSFEETWVECLGDLSRYRMAIEEEDMKDREVWTATARFWYCKASDISPGTGRLQHHLAILARNSPIQQLSLYARSLCSEQPFAAGRDSVLTVLEPVLAGEHPSGSRLPAAEFSFIRLHGVMFVGEDLESFEPSMSSFLRQLDIHIGRITTKWKLPGAYMAITNICALLKYGAQESPFWNMFSEQTRDNSQADPEVADKKIHTISNELRLFNATFSLVLGRVGDRNVLGFVHVVLVFLWRISTVAYDTEFLHNDIPWTELASFMNSFARLQQFPKHVEPGKFATLLTMPQRALPEDYAIRGQVWSSNYFPTDWFESSSMDHDERYMELQSNGALRTERVLWLGYLLSTQSRRFAFDSSTKTFSAR